MISYLQKIESKNFCQDSIINLALELAIHLYSTGLKDSDVYLGLYQTFMVEFFLPE